VNEHEMVTLSADPKPLELDIKRTAVLIIDMQNAFCRKGGMFDLGGRDISLIPQTYGPIRRVSTVAREKGIKVVYVVHRLTPDLREVGPLSRYSFRGMVDRPDVRDKLILQGTWGAEIIDELAPRQDEMVIEKRRFSAFVGTELDMMLKTFDIRYLIFTGVATNICVESSLRDASHLQYLPILVSDGVAASPPSRQESTLANVREVFGWVTTSDNIVSALRR
jgi:ureidoacrylate peracid hydrolase